ncbi:MAG: hypothetical protein IJM19_03575 [Ruminococcus sp.]|nr:hypothetical protein [Ruminococcus sp.]
MKGKDNQDYLCFADFEFTCGKGISRWKCEILSVGLVICDNKYRIKENFYCTCRPNKSPELTEECKKLTLLKQDEIDNSPDSDDVMSAAVRLVHKYNIKKIFVWGNFDKPALKSDIRIHNKIKKESMHISRICSIILDIQEETIKKMSLPQAVNIEELAGAFGFVPSSGTFHNALNDALALFTIYRSIYTTDFENNENFIKIKNERTEKIETQKRIIEEKRRTIALSLPLNEKEKTYYDKICENNSEESISEFIFLRYKCISSIQRNPDDLYFYFVVFNDKTNIKVVPESKYETDKNRSALRVERFAKAQFGSVVLRECYFRKKLHSTI